MSRFPAKLLTSIFAAAAASALPAQTILSDFEGPTADGWTGSINPTLLDPPFPTGSTMTSGIVDSGNGVLNITDGGFYGGAVRTYTGLPTSGFLTFAVRGRIVVDADNLGPNFANNPPQLGSSFGVAAGSTGLGDQAFAYSTSLGTDADDDDQPFALYAATVRADGSGAFTTFFNPDVQDGAVGLGNWNVRLDDVQLIGGGTDVLLSDFAAGTEAWARTTIATSPFPTGGTVVAHAGGELQITDAGFSGAAFKTYAGAVAVAGVHVVKVDVRIEADPGTLTRSRIAATAGGPTTDYATLALSQSFATDGDDSMQAYQTVAVPVITNGPSDVTVYVLSDSDGSVGAGNWDIRIDNVRVQTCMPASSSIYGSGTVHPQNGFAQLSVIDDLRLGTTGKLRLNYNNASADRGTLLVGFGRASLPIFDGVILLQFILLDSPFAPATPFTSLDFDFPVPNDATLCSALPLNFQVVMLDSNMVTPFGLVFSNGAEMFVGY